MGEIFCKIKNEVLFMILGSIISIDLSAILVLVLGVINLQLALVSWLCMLDLDTKSKDSTYSGNCLW